MKLLSSLGIRKLTHWLFPIYVHSERVCSSVFQFIQWIARGACGASMPLRGSRLVGCLCILVMHLDKAIIESSYVISTRAGVYRAIVAICIDHKMVVEELDLCTVVFVLNDPILLELCTRNEKFYNSRCAALLRGPASESTANLLSSVGCTP